MSSRESSGVPRHSRSSDSLNGSWIEVYSNGEGDFELVSGQETPLDGSFVASGESSAALRAMLREAVGRFDGSPHPKAHLPHSPMLEPVTDESEGESQHGDDDEDDHRGLMKSLSALMSSVGEIELPSPCFSPVSKATFGEGDSRMSRSGLNSAALSFCVDHVLCYQCRWERRLGRDALDSGAATPLSVDGFYGGNGSLASFDLIGCTVGAGLKGAIQKDAHVISPFRDLGCAGTAPRPNVFLCKRHLMDADALWDWSYSGDATFATSTPTERKEIRVREGRRRYRRGKLK
eukprot:Opistho-2@27729